MSKKLYFLISFVLVLSLGGLAQAADAIKVTNPSFEYDANCDGNTVPGHAGYGAICDWNDNYPTGDESPWVGVDVQCPYANSTHCHRWPASDGVVYSYIQANGGNAYQVLDMNNSDANGVIVAGRKYTLTYDALGWGGDEHTASLFYVDDVNYPDANHNELASETYDVWYIERDLGDCEGTSDLDALDECPDWTYDLTVTFVAETGALCIGKTLGFKITTLPSVPGGGGYTFVDNFGMEWSWASEAYDPDPADEAEDTPMDVNLAWSPGLWAVGDVNGHEVYFGTDYTEVYNATTATVGIYRGSGVGIVSGPDVNNRYSYDVLEILELGRPYYWRIDEVNEAWLAKGGGPVPPVNDRWKGDVWGFRTIGYAYNVYPADGAEDIPSLNLTLRWLAGDSAGGHDVYFGSDETAVENATTATPGIYRGPTQPLADVNYDVPENLDVGIDYFWRIDEVNTAGAGTLVTGDVWSFTVGMFILVDSFEPYRYVTTGDLTAVWVVDLVAQPKNDAQLSLYFAKTDANKVYSGDQSMEFAYRCYKADAGVQVGSWAAADMPVEVGTDWTVAGVKALVVNFYGDPCNGIEPTPYDITQDQMWVAVEDTGTNEGVVRLPNMSKVKEASWHTWDISLIDPNFSAVDMNNVKRVYIGFGGAKVGQKGTGAGYKTGNHDSVWFDDIRLYPPRCMPEVTGLDVLHALGDFTGPYETEDCNTDYFDLEMMAADWMKIDGLVSTKNQPAVLSEFPAGDSHWATGYIGGAIEVNNVEGEYKIDVLDPRLPGLTSMSITGWVKQPAITQQKYCALVASREAPGGATELMVDNGDGVAYGWNGLYWAWKSNLDVPDNTWTFIALAVEPTQATVYMHPDPCNAGVMESATNVAEHETLVHFVTQFRIGRSNPDDKQFKGLMDDVRVYDWTLTEANMLQLSTKTGEPNAWPIYWYKFDEVSGLSAADSGFGTQIYQENILPTNIVPKDPCESADPNLGSGALDPNNMDIINFRDYRKMAENWLMGPFMWPPAL